MKNILIASAVFPPEPITSAAMNYDLAKALSSKYHVIVLRAYPTRPCGSQYEISDDSRTEPFEVVTLDSYTCPASKLIGRFRESISYSRAVIKYLKKSDIEIDFIYNDAWQLFGYNILAHYAVKHHIPYIMPVQDIYPESLYTRSNYPSWMKKLINLFFLPMEKYSLKHAAKVRTISQEMVDYLSTTRKLPKEQFVIINNWQDDSVYQVSKLNHDEKPLVFSYVGSINDHANVDLMIRAFHDANIPNSLFRIYGNGDKKQYCQELVQKLQLNNVVFSIVPKDEVPQIQANSDVLILALPTNNGTYCLPSKLVSYMLSKTPVIASVDNNSATSRIIGEADCGQVVRPDRVNELADAMCKMGQMSRMERTHYGENGYQYAQRFLTKQKNLQILLDCIDEVI